MFSNKRRSYSLALRLSGWYAGSAFLLLAVATGFLYWVLATTSDTEDDQLLAEKIDTLGRLLARQDFRTVQWEVEGESASRQSVALLSRIIGADGRIVVETGAMSAELAPSMFPNPGDSVERNSLRQRPFRLRSDQFGAYRVQVAIEVTHEQKLLLEYRRRLWAVLAGGLLIAVLVGYRIARRGVQPVEEIAAAVRRIGSTTLHQRLETEGMPRELAGLAATFNDMLDRLEDGFGRLARFSSDIAHELRTPVSNLRGELEVALAKARPPEEYREVLGSALEESLRVTRLIESLLFLARAENPGTEIRREPVDAAAELAAVREFYEPAAAEAGVSLELTPGDPAAAQLDRTLFQRAVGNLVENALAYTPAGGRVTLSAARRNGVLEVTVADNGAGIPPQHLPYVFERFHRADPSRSRDGGGTGLGLAIVRSIAALHGGRAGIESELGHGTRVTLVFPVS